MHYLSHICIEHLGMKLILVDKVVLPPGLAQQQSIHMIVLKHTRCHDKMLRLLSNPCVHHLQCNMEHRILFTLRRIIKTILVKDLVKEHVAKWIDQKVWGSFPSGDHV